MLSGVSSESSNDEGGNELEDEEDNNESDFIDVETIPTVVQAAKKDQKKKSKKRKILTDNQMKINAWEILQRYANQPINMEVETFSKTVALKLNRINNENRRLDAESKILRILNEAISLNHQNDAVTLNTQNHQNDVITPNTQSHQNDAITLNAQNVALPLLTVRNDATIDATNQSVETSDPGASSTSFFADYSKYIQL